MAEKTEIDIRKVFRIVLGIFGVSLLATLLLGYWGFCVPPKGVIDTSVLQFTTIIMGGNTTFNAFILGFLAIVKGKVTRFKTAHGEVTVGHQEQTNTEK